MLTAIHQTTNDSPRNALNQHRRMSECNMTLRGADKRDRLANKSMSSGSKVVAKGNITPVDIFECIGVVYD